VADKQTPAKPVGLKGTPRRSTNVTSCYAARSLIEQELEIPSMGELGQVKSAGSELRKDEPMLVFAKMYLSKCK
jgi:hypothetical protein